MDEWNRVKIGDLCEIIKGETGLASAPPGLYPLVATGAERKTCTTWQFDTEAVCIPLVSSTGHGKKTLNYVHYQSGKFALGTILAAVIPKDPSVLIARFLHLYLSHFKDTVLVPLMRGAANVSLPMKEIASVEIPVPPLDEQHNLIDLIFRIEDEHRELLVETNQQAELLIQLRQAVLQEAVEGKLTATWRKQHPVVMGDPRYDAEALLAQIKTEKERLVKEGKNRKEKPLPPISDTDKPFDLPDGWVWCRLGGYGFTQTGTTPPTIDKANYGDFIPFIKPGDVATSAINYKNEGLTEKGLLQGRLIEKSSILMVCIGGSIGKSFFTDRDVSCNQQINTITPLGGVEARFLQQFLQSIYFQTEVWDKAMKSSTPIINKGRWEEIAIPLPPLTEQQAIFGRVDSLMAAIDELEKQVNERKEQTQLLMKTVLREAFEGGMAQKE